MADPTTVRTGRTTSLAGVLVGLAAVIEVLRRSGASLPLLKTFVVPLDGPVPALLVALLTAAGFTVAAVGTGREPGVAGRARVGTAALVVYGAGGLLQFLAGLIPVGITLPIPPEVLLGNLALQLLIVAAGVVAALAVLRARVLAGPARWALVPLVALDLLLLLASWVPLGDLQLALVVIQVDLIRSALLLAVAVVLLLHGRAEAIKHRVRVLRDAW